MEQKITKEQALEVAEMDYYDGILTAIKKLNEFGFETPIYWAFIAQIWKNGFDVDDYNMNCDVRDLQFKALGIWETMKRAYDEVWER
jgi:hypothetical protein